MSITLTPKQLRCALEFMNPDGPEATDQQDSDYTIEWMPERTAADGEPMAAGYYVYATEYPGEGVYGPL